MNYVDNNNYFFFQGSLEKQVKVFTFDARYSYGNINLSRYLLSNDAGFPQVISLSARYQYIFANQCFVLYPYVTYSYSNLIGSTLNIDPELFYFTKNGWRFKMEVDLNSNFKGENVKMVAYNSSLNSENQSTAEKTSYAFNLNVGIRKEFGIPIPTKKILYNTTEFVAYLDLNGNHRYDPNEDVLENVVISINGNEVLTNEKGYAKIENIEAGVYPFFVFSLVDLKGWFPDKEDSINMTMGHNKKYIAFSRGVKLYGSVILNREKFSDIAQIDLSRIKISAVDSKVYSTLTDANGAFSFYLPCGKYIISLDEKVLGDKFKLSQNNIEVNLTNDLENIYIPFYVIEKQRKVKMKKFDSNGNEISNPAEMYGKIDGCGKGKGGSMHLIDVTNGVMGASAVVGTTIPNAMGFAYALKIQEKDNLVVSFFGDGGTDKGVFYESLNFAALKNVPLIFVCENNGYAIHTHQRLRQSVPDITAKAAAFGIPAVPLDNDVLNINKAVSEAVEAIRIQKKARYFLNV